MSRDADRWHVGNVVVTRVVDVVQSALAPHLVFAELDPASVLDIGWLRPHYVDESGMLNFSIHAFVIESEGRRIIVDTCVGNDKQRSTPGLNQRRGPFLSQLRDAGYPPESIDLVVCTHLHVDHVGWNTRWIDGMWVPTFPNARYLFGRLEWEHWNTVRSSNEHGAEDDLDIAAVIADSVTPIVDAGLHNLVEQDHQLTEEVALFPTPGHTPGHVSVRIRSGGKECVITGDIAHHPIQFALPALNTVFDTDDGAARKTREEFLAAHAGRDVLVLGTHFPSPSGGYIVRTGASWRFDTTASAAIGEGVQ